MPRPLPAAVGLRRHAGASPGGPSRTRSARARRGRGRAGGRRDAGRPGRSGQPVQRRRAAPRRCGPGFEIDGLFIWGFTAEPARRAAAARRLGSRRGTRTRPAAAAGETHAAVTRGRAGASGRPRAVLAACVLIGGCVGCSNRTASINRRPQSSDSVTASVVNGVQQVTVYAGDTYRFTPDVITVHPGPVQVTLVHTGTGAPHDLQVLGFPADFVPLVNPGGTSTATFTAPAPGHLHVRLHDPPGPGADRHADRDGELSVDLLDLFILLAAVGYAVGGYRNGAVVGLFSLAGFLGGAVAGAQLGTPARRPRSPTGRARSSSRWSACWSVALVGQLAMVFVARLVRSRITWRTAQAVDSGIGALLGVVSVLLVAWMVAVPLASSPYPTLASQARHSAIVAQGQRRRARRPAQRVLLAAATSSTAAASRRCSTACSRPTSSSVGSPDAALADAPASGPIEPSVLKIYGTRAELLSRDRGLGLRVRTRSDAHQRARRRRDRLGAGAVLPSGQQADRPRSSCTTPMSMSPCCGCPASRRRRCRSRRRRRQRRQRDRARLPRGRAVHRRARPASATCR